MTITANNQTKVYGAALPTLTANYVGFVNGDTSASLTTQPTLGSTATASSHVSGSPYSITASGAADSDYTFTYVAGTMTVTTTALTITAVNKSKVYGAALPTLTANYTGFVNGDTSASLATKPTLSTTATTASHVAGSPYSITATGAVDTDYTISYVGGSLTVNPATLTITASNQTKVYGAALPSLTASYGGFVNGDTSASLATQPSLSTTATASSHVSGNPYSITASGAVNGDYTIGYNAGTLTVTAAPLTITASDQTKVYGSALPTLTASYVGFVNGDTSSNLATQPNLSTTATAASHVVGSPYNITASGAVDTDYSFTYVTGHMTVTQAPLTITANDQTKVYGAALPALTATYTGFVNGDTSTSLTTQPTLASTATASSHVSGNPYSITASGAVDGDYSISYVPGTLTVTTASLTITANNQTKVYGAALPTLTASYSGFVNGDSSASLATQPSLSTTATAASHLSGNPYGITASGAVDVDYTIGYSAGTLTVTAAPLTITASNQTMVYGAALPTLTASYVGFVNGDTSASLTSQPSLTTTATATSHVAGSPYSITASGAVGSGLCDQLRLRRLTITAAPLTITADDQTKVYGAALPTLTASYVGFVNSDTSESLAAQPTLTTTATTSSHVAAGPYDITVGGAEDPDYTIGYADGILTVTPAPLTITADDQTKAYGDDLPALTASYSGFVNGDASDGLATLPTLSTTATASSHVAGSPYAITAIGAADPDYTIGYVDGALTVTPAALTITADDQTKVYGAELPDLTASYSGFVNGDTSDSLTTSPALSTTATAASHVADSPYAITASGAVDSDYTITYVAGDLSVTPAALTITPDDQTKVYGAELPELTASYSGFENGDGSDSLTTEPALSTTATAASEVAGDPYSITASGAVNADYTISYVAGTLIVTPASLTITADDQTMVYGAELPELTATYSGFVNGDGSDSLTVQPTLTTTATASSHVDGSPYSVAASGAVDSDYTIAYAGGALTVTPASLTIAADDQTKVYGADLPGLTASYGGFVNGDTSDSLTAQPTLSTTATASSHVAGGPYAISASDAVDDDYAITYLAGNLTITPADLTITADDQSMVYGSGLPELTASYAGLVNGDTSDSLATQPTLSTTATAASHVAGSPYDITASGAVDGDYSIGYAGGTLSVTPAPLTITADDQTKVYGDDLPGLTASYLGFVNGDTFDSLTAQPTLTTTATAASHVSDGPYDITVGGAEDPDYIIGYADGTLTVTPAPLTITADDQTKVYGDDLPELTASYAGFVNGDASADLATQPTLTTTATVASHVSGNPYSITPAGAAASDYTISYVSGSLAITPAALTITADDQTKVYGDDLPELTASYSGFVNGDIADDLATLPTLTTTATAASHVDGGPYDITASGAVDGDYTIAYASGTLTVTTASLTITADDQTKVYGADLPELTATYSGFVNGDTSDSLETPPMLATTATASSHVSGGPYDITIGGADDPDYTIGYADGTLTVTPAPLTITADDQTKVYGAELPGLTASYLGFVNGDTSDSLTTQPSLSTTATASSHVAGGPYAITAIGAAESDYSISYADGKLSVTPASLTITANNQTKVYGADLPELTASYSGLVSGDTPASLSTPPTLSTTASSASHVTDGPYAITVAGAIDSDYSINYAGGSLVVTPAPLTIVADDQSMVVGTGLPVLTATYVGLVEGDTTASMATPVVLSTTATDDTPVGRYPIVASGAKAPDYDIRFVNGTLTVTPQPFAFATSTAIVAAQSNQGTILVATVTATSTGQPMVNGRVAFYNGTELLGTAPVIGGIASLNVAARFDGSFRILAFYSGMGSYGPSSSSVNVMSDGPKVVGLSRYGFHARPTVLTLNFDSPLNPSRAQDTSNYVLVNRHGDRIAIKIASYDPATQTVTLKPVHRLKIRRAYTLTIRGTSPDGLTGASGIPLDGAGTGEPQTNFTARIRWTALTLPDDPPAVMYINGQPRPRYTGCMNRYLQAFMRAFRASIH